MPKVTGTYTTGDAKGLRENLTDMIYNISPTKTPLMQLAGRDKATATPHTAHTYLLRTTAPTVVSTSQLNPAGDPVTTYALYDGLLRIRQTQAPSPSGGRLLSDTFYDTSGRAVMLVRTTSGPVRLLGGFRRRHRRPHRGADAPARSRKDRDRRSGLPQVRRHQGDRPVRRIGVAPATSV